LTFTGAKSTFASYLGSSGFVVTPQQAASIKQYNELVRNGVTSNSQLSQALHGCSAELKGFARQSGYAEINVKKLNGQFIAGASGIKGFGSTLKLACKGLIAFGAQFALISAAMWALSKIVEGVKWAYDEFSMSIKATAKRAEESAVALEETTSELESLEDELKNVKERMAELQSMGSLTLTEQSELKTLQLESVELQKQIKLLKERKRIEQDALIKDNVNAIHAMDYQKTVKVDYGTPNAYNDSLTIPEEFAYRTEQLEKYKKALAELSVDDENYEYYNQFYNDQIKEQSNAITELSLAIDSYRVNLEDVPVAEKAYFEALYNAENRALLENGTLSITDFIDANLFGEDLDNVSKQMQEMAKSATISTDDVRNAFSQNVIPILTEAGFTAKEAEDAILQHINALRNTGDVVSDVISSDSNFLDIQNTIDEITSSDFEITTDSITEAVGQDFVTALDKASISISDFCNWLSSMQNAVEEISVKDTVKELSGIEEKLNSLSDAYYEFVDNAGKVDAKTLDGFAETFADISDTDAYADFIKTIGNSSSTVSQLQTALDELVTTYFRQESTVEDLNEDTLQLYAAQLKQMGVVNALEVAQHELNLRTIESAEYTDDEVDALYDAVVGLELTGDAAEDTAIKLALFESYQEYIANNNFAEVCESHGKSILKVAEAAGASAPILAKYLQVMSAIEEFQQRVATYGTSAYVGGAGLYYKGLLDEAAGLAEQAEAEYKSIFTGGVQVKFTPTKDKDKSGGDKDPDKEAYDKAKAKLDNQLERNKISYEEYYKELVKLGNKYFKGDAENMREHYATLADVRRDAYAKYQGDLDKDLANGVISLQTYYDKSKALSKEWLDGRKANEEDYKEAVEAIYDAVNDAWGDRISQMETRLERMTLDKNWEPGKTEADYWNKMLEELEQDYINGLFDSTDEYYDHRYDLLKKLDEAKKESWENELDAIQESKDSIQDLIDLVSDMMKHELEEQIDALEKQKDLYSEIVDEKKKSLELTREENEYQKQLEEYNRDLAELQAKAAVLALDDSREGKAQYAAIMEQIREKQNEIQSSQSDHTYDATTEALDAAQSAYEEKIEKQVSDIQALMEEAGPWLERVYERIEQTPPSKLLADLTRYNYYHGTGMDSDVQRIWAASEGLLTSFDSNVPKILAYLETQEKTLQAQIDASGSDSGSDLSDNYVSDLNKKVQASVTRNQSDATNMGLLDDVRAQYGSGWYDTQNKVIYLGEDGDRRVSAGAANLIQQMESVKNSKAKKSEKEKQLNELLTKLKRKWGYGDAHIEWDGSTPHLYKTAGKSEKWQIFHDGYTRGYVGQSNATYTPDAKQRELLALLEAGELVVNKTQQGYLLSQLQTLQTLSDGLRKLQLDSVPGDTYGVGEINIEVNAPITITGSADADTIKELEKFKKNLSNDVLGEVTSAMKRKGYGRNTAVNARKK
jgi:hypothetical protein